MSVRRGLRLLGFFSVLAVSAACDPAADPVWTTRAFIWSVWTESCDRAWTYYSRERQRAIEAESSEAVQREPHYAEIFAPQNLYCRPTYAHRYDGLSAWSATLVSEDGNEASVSVLLETGSRFALLPFLSEPYRETPVTVRLVREEGRWRIAKIGSPEAEAVEARAAEVRAREEEARRAFLERRAREQAGADASPVLPPPAPPRAPPDPTPPTPPALPPPARDLTGNLLRNGGFAGLAPWAEYRQSNVPHRATVAAERGAVVWERTESRSDGGLVGVYQDVSVDVSSFRALETCLDVRVDHHSLPNTGWWSEEHGGGGEAPAKIVLRYADGNGAVHEWERSFLLTNEPATSIRSFDLVPGGEWRHFCFDLFDDAVRRDPRGAKVLPRPARIERVHLLGSGWDFRAAAANVVLRGG